MNAGNLATLFMGTSALSAGVQGFGQYLEGRSQAEAYEYNAKVAGAEASAKEREIRRKNAILIGQQRALYAEAGVDVSSGSPLSVIALQAMEAEEEALAVRRGGQSQAGVQEYYADIARTTGLMRGASTFITGLGSSMTQYAKQKKLWQG